jgi:hypothetical protein
MAPLAFGPVLRSDVLLCGRLAIVTVSSLILNITCTGPADKVEKVFSVPEISNC